MGGGTTDDMRQVTGVKSVVVYKYRVQMIVGSWGGQGSINIKQQDA